MCFCMFASLPFTPLFVCISIGSQVSFVKSLKFSNFYHSIGVDFLTCLRMIGYGKTCHDLHEPIYGIRKMLRLIFESVNITI